MTEFKAGDRVEYGSHGPVSQHHGKRGTVSHIAKKGGWIMVDFDCGDQQIQCSEISLIKIAEPVDPEALMAFALMLAMADIHANSLVNANTGALMDVQSIRRTARHILKMD